jgi:colanic acid biosynthesis glycosyl transferase WcaI
MGTGEENFMRILIVTHYFEPDSGAAAVRLSRLARLLHQRGHDVTVLTTMPHYPQGHISDAYRGKWSIVENRDGLRVIRAWLWATPSPKISRRLLGQMSFMVTAALRGLSLPRPDVVLIESQPVFTSLAGWFVSFAKRTPYVLNVSDFWPEYLLAVGAVKENSLIYRLFYRLVNWTFRGAKQIITLYPPLSENVESRIGQGQKIHTIYNAVDLQRFRPGLDTTMFRQQHSLGDAKLVSFIGTFGTHIDFETMLDVAAHFNNRSDVQFVFIGTGGQKGRVAERLEQGDISNSSWVGWVDHQDMPLAWNASYITFWAIHDHELYRSILQSKTYEAMASGVPMVIAVEGITVDILQRSNAGLTVAFKDKAGLIANIERMLGDEELRNQQSQAARTYAEQHFDPEKVADAYISVLETAAKR